mmetsp:Transcript_28971/g.69961  ORF Transcript_28971/g.69961 Transcript_28971/m.69961 type:complete len:96 (+) Transcript_28971:161-448(+)
MQPASHSTSPFERTKKVTLYCTVLVRSSTASATRLALSSLQPVTELTRASNQTNQPQSITKRRLLYRNTASSIKSNQAIMKPSTIYATVLTDMSN